MSLVPPVQPGTVVPDDDATVFSVLAARARGHPVSHLWTATLIGAADTLAVVAFRPQWWGLALVSVALTAFGAWGLADAALEEPRGPVARTRPGALALRLTRAIATVTGTVAVLALVFALIAVMLEGWRH